MSGFQTVFWQGHCRDLGRDSDNMELPGNKSTTTLHSRYIITFESSHGLEACINLFVEKSTVYLLRWAFLLNLYAKERVKEGRKEWSTIILAPVVGFMIDVLSTGPQCNDFCRFGMMKLRKASGFINRKIPLIVWTNFKFVTVGHGSPELIGFGIIASSQFNVSVVDGRQTKVRSKHSNLISRIRIFKNLKPFLCFPTCLDPH